MDDKAYNVTEDANASMASHLRLVLRAFNVESSPPARSFEARTLWLPFEVRSSFLEGLQHCRGLRSNRSCHASPVSCCNMRTEFAACTRKKSEDYGRIIREANIKLE
jgi:hypothetical protein